MSVGHAPEGERRAELGSLGGRGPLPTLGEQTSPGCLNICLSIAREEQRPRLVIPGDSHSQQALLGATRMSPRTEDRARWRCLAPAGTVCRTPASPTALQPTPGRPASEQRVLLIRVPVSWGLAEGGVRRPSEQATFAGKASAGGLPRGRVCPGMACGKVPGQKGPFTTSRAGISNLF